MMKIIKSNKKESKESEKSKKQKKPLKEKSTKDLKLKEFDKLKDLTLVSIDYGGSEPLTLEEFKKLGGYTIGGGEPIEIPPEFIETLKELDAEWEKLHPVSLDTALAAEKILDGNKKEKEEFKTTKKSKERKKNKNGS